MGTTSPEMNHEDGNAAAESAGISRLVRSWSVEFPTILYPWVPALADAFADGAWLARWPRIAGIGPVAGLAVGFLTPFLWPGMYYVYSESLIFLLLISISSIVGGSLGAALLLGYVGGDLMHESLGIVGFLGTHYLRSAAGHVVGYLLLAILVVRIPPLARRLTKEIQWLPADAKWRTATQRLMYAGACAGLIFLWCQGTIVLIRPVFTWAGIDPTDAAVMQVQVHWRWLVTAAFLATLARIGLESSSISNPVRASLMSEFQERKHAIELRATPWWQTVSARTRVALGAIFMTIILAGTYAGWMDPIIVLIVSGAVGAWRAGLLGGIPRGWVSLMNKIPAAARMIIVPLAGFEISDALLRTFWAAGSLRPVMFGALITVVLFYVMFPQNRSAGTG